MSRSKSRGRDTRDIANRRLPLSAERFNALPLHSRSPFYSVPLTLYEDRRTWDPVRKVDRPARSFSTRSYHTDIARPTSTKYIRPTFQKPRTISLWSSLPAGIAFRSPSRVLICVRRGIRREIMFALNKAGRVGQKRPRRNEYSGISC